MSTVEDYASLLDGVVTAMAEAKDMLNTHREVGILDNRKDCMLMFAGRSCDRLPQGVQPG